MENLAFIDRQSPLPLHEQCKRLLLDRIRSGALQPGDAIPPERELGAIYGLSRTTVRQAVNDLVQQGILHKVQGSGTFVTKTVIPLDLHRFTSFTEDMKARERTPSSQILRMELSEAPEVVRRSLSLAGPAFMIERLRLADRKPMGIHTVYLPPELRIERAVLESEGSLYNALARIHHLHLVAADETLEAAPASARDARLLGLEKGAPILRVERVSFNNRSEPREFVEMRYRSDEYKYYARLNRP